MRNFYFAIWSVIVLFLLILVGVGVVALRRPSNSTGIDPAQIRELRNLAEKRI